MNPYENALIQVVEHLLKERNCYVSNSLVRDRLVIMLRMREFLVCTSNILLSFPLLSGLRYIAVSVSNGANHAGRTTPSYFDVERTLRQLGVQVQDLRAVRSASEKSQQSQKALVKFRTCETRDEDFHQCSQLDTHPERSSRSGRHIPKFLPPFPSVHTYRNSIMEIYTDRNYVSQRERRAQHRISTQCALNGYYVRTRKTMSLFSEPQRGTEFLGKSRANCTGYISNKLFLSLVLSSNQPKQAAYRDALMPRDEIFDEDIYEFNEEPNEKGRKHYIQNIKWLIIVKSFRS